MEEPYAVRQTRLGLGEKYEEDRHRCADAVFFRAILKFRVSLWTTYSGHIQCPASISYSISVRTFAFTKTSDSGSLR